MSRPVFDAHLDLADLAVMGRRMTAPLDPAMEPHPPAAVTLPSLREGHVRCCLATIFTAPRTPGTPAGDPVRYEVNDPDDAHRKGVAQLEVYRTWRDTNLARLDLPRVLVNAARTDPHVGEIRGGMGVAELQQPSFIERVESAVHADDPGAPVHLAVLLENADPVRTPDELAWWAEEGLAAVGMAWWASSRYAAGNGVAPEDDFAITDLGRAFIAEMDRLGLVHDQSHLSDGAVHALYERTDRTIIASHSNCRAIVGEGDPRRDQRHLTDDMIREIARRGGVIGLNLIKNFIRPGMAEDDPARPSIDEALDHVEHICAVTGSTDHVGIGTDMDGGISANDIPEGINQPADLVKLCEGLRARGWSDDRIDAFRLGNWARCLASAWQPLVVRAPTNASSD